jgi:hypothetical protein
MSNDPPIPVIRGKYVPGYKEKPKARGYKLAAHFKYIQHRPLGEKETREDRFIFSEECDHIERKEALDDVMRHSSHSVNYHKIILSPADHEHIDDYRQWTRDVMNDLQTRKGVELHWYAVVHAHPRENTDTPHVHVVLAGAGEDRETGQMKTVRIDAPDYQYLREQGREHSNFEFYRTLDKEMQELSTEDTITRESSGQEMTRGDQTTLERDIER